MSFSGFEKRRLRRPEAPLRAVIECENGAVGGYVENLTLDGLYMRLKKRDFAPPKERVSLDLFLAASNGPSVFRTEARVVQIDETGIFLQFRPMTLSHHNRLKMIIAFIASDEEGDPSDVET